MKREERERRRRRKGRGRFRKSSGGWKGGFEIPYTFVENQRILVTKLLKMKVYISKVARVGGRIYWITPLVIYGIDN